MASVDDRVQYGPLKKLEVKNCVAYSGITCILGFLLFAFILMLIPGDVPEPPVLYGVISGVVLGPDNLPVENIEVSCPSFETVTTNANGEFSFPEAVYGEYVLAINHPNYEQETVNVVLGASNVDVEISLTFLYGVISGVVLGPDNLPVENIEVSCPSFETVTTNADGEFSLPEAVYGEYVITINAPNYEQESVNVVLNASNVEIEISLTFSPASVRIEARYSTTTDTVALVQLTLTCGSYSETQTTGIGGAFTFSNVERGDCNVVPHKSGFVPQSHDFVVNSLSHTEQVFITPVSGLAVNVAHFSTGQAINNQRVTVHGPTSFSGNTNIRGNIHFDTLILGATYTITIEREGFHPLQHIHVLSSTTLIHLNLTPL
ncbi:hypothetical protein RCL1_006491 [Eukaryota sp. TZLM3-RCL]